jgi:hypothetical protein
MSSIVDCHHIWPEAYRYFQAALQALHFITALTPLLAFRTWKPSCSNTRCPGLGLVLRPFAILGDKTLYRAFNR